MPGIIDGSRTVTDIELKVLGVTINDLFPYDINKKDQKTK